MGSFRLEGRWNGGGIRLSILWKFLEDRGINLRKEDVLIKWHEDGNWDFFGKPKPESKVEIEVEEPSIDEDKPSNSDFPTPEPRPEPKPRPKKEKPLCPKCGTEHWPMHKCPRKENKWQP